MYSEVHDGKVSTHIPCNNYYKTVMETEILSTPSRDTARTSACTVFTFLQSFRFIEFNKNIRLGLPTEIHNRKYLKVPL